LLLFMLLLLEEQNFETVAIIDAVVSKIFKLLLLLPSLLLFLEENDLESFIFFFVEVLKNVV